jgi:hypothetical protein
MPQIEDTVVISKDYFQLFFEVGFFLSLLPWICMLFLTQGMEVQPITMAALRSNLADRKMYGYSAGIVIVSLLGMIMVSQSLLSEFWSIAGAVLCGGLLLDLLRMTYCRFQYRRTPEGLAEWFIEVTKKSVKQRDETWHSICFEVPFGMMLVYIKSGTYGSLRLFCHNIVEISNVWLGSIAGIVMSSRVPGEFEVSVLDRYVHAELSTAKHIAWLLQQSCAIGSFTGVEETTRLAGKLFVNFHKYHKSLGSVLLLTLYNASQKEPGKIALFDLDMEVIETLTEVIKSLIDSCIDQNTIETECIVNILTILESKVKDILVRETNVNLAFLKHPFSEIHHMLGYKRYRSFQGRDEILAGLHGILTLLPSFEGEWVQVT